MAPAVQTYPTPLAELTANCEHGNEADRGEFFVGTSARALRWRILFCNPCWEHFRHHQDVIDLRYFEDSPPAPDPR